MLFSSRVRVRIRFEDTKRRTDFVHTWSKCYLLALTQDLTYIYHLIKKYN